LHAWPVNGKRQTFVRVLTSRALPAQLRPLEQRLRRALGVSVCRALRSNTFRASPCETLRSLRRAVSMVRPPSFGSTIDSLG